VPHDEEERHQAKCSAALDDEAARRRPGAAQAQGVGIPCFPPHVPLRLSSSRRRVERWVRFPLCSIFAISNATPSSRHFAASPLSGRWLTLNSCGNRPTRADVDACAGRTHRVDKGNPTPFDALEMHQAKIMARALTLEVVTPRIHRWPYCAAFLAGVRQCDGRREFKSPESHRGARGSSSPLRSGR
jgi:hypothetical protein